MSEFLKKLEPFDRILARAIERKGSKEIVMDMAGDIFDADEIASLSDDRWLAAFTKQVFQSGFVWRVVEQKWSGFEEVFFNFDIEKMLMMSDEMWEQKCKDERIIRNGNKVMTIKANAQMIYEVSAEHGSFGKFIANWPCDDIIGLWQFLKKHGARLGGNTGPYALRFMGKDGFLISRDNEAYFRAYKLVDGGISSKKSQTVIQQCFNAWHESTGLTYKQLSRILSFSVGDNFVGIEAGTNTID
ncbi:DNA-3-methyladenine glycosylase I [Psychrosphaera sp. B3R10]|uniref:DNA-3-methyladenine glycosylase I n=1 Tax=unclassified Psychrosphaera TaxID=2641570 RepID=UPI001C08B88A|nr:MULTISPECIES: DNA-3-methyladenine glycosylase I [unclassified Psychrosphaera]MBU2883174.1 DNA-3-methyladenine glycosylase I [Psychrosphaera sp. I2R16]MBU2988630.1 DNA-3-methyladenine glycosylase I [Psychrosphaera sp. B3R10]MDO6719693.1 DNA-3-methyladenine glycosylase I [Psychrosphaera sp. 1_MG-2023]